MTEVQVSRRALSSSPLTILPNVVRPIRIWIWISFLQFFQFKFSHPKNQLIFKKKKKKFHPSAPLNFFVFPPPFHTPFPCSCLLNPSYKYLSQKPINYQNKILQERKKFFKDKFDFIFLLFHEKWWIWIGKLK